MRKKRSFRPRSGKKGYSTVATGYRSRKSASRHAKKMKNAHVYKKGKTYGIRSK